MTDEQQLEIRGEDVAKAIQAGLQKLGLGRDDVDIVVLDEGSGGILGIGRRDAMVRLTVKQMPTQEDEIEQAVATPGIEVEELTSDYEPIGEYEPMADLTEFPEQEVALDVVKTLVAKMAIEAKFNLRQSEPDDLTGERRWIIDIHGQDMGVLIGPRGETLNSLQYIARLMTGHKTHERSEFIIDVEGYRERREQALAKLAERMAGKVISRGRPMTLEPMPPNERRIIHLTLRKNNKVYTESTGEGNHRKVRIYPKD